MADELGVAERVYALAGEPFTDEARAAVGDYLAGHRRGRLGNVETSYEMFGLDEGNCANASRHMSSDFWPKLGHTFSTHGHYARAGRCRTQILSIWETASRSTSQTPVRPMARR